MENNINKDGLRIEPPCWWTGMVTPLQLMIHGENISGSTLEVSGGNIIIKEIHPAESPNYLFVDIEIPHTAAPGKYTFTLAKEGEKKEFEYELHERREGSAARKSFDSSDLVYLLMTDRFARGGEEWTPNEGIADDTMERDNPIGRHGGDIKGIAAHLDYLEKLGVTALWITPMQLNNENEGTYHGYAIADYYRTDPRFGDNEEYRELVAESHKKGIKVIMDVVLNHCGMAHWWMDDLPFTDWVHVEQEDITSTYRLVALTDPNAAPGDLARTVNGWFDKIMPDMALENPFVLRYFIQAYVWWVEWAYLDGLRVDTFPYNDRYAAAKWTRAILDEYPNLNIVAECWHSSPAIVSYWDGRVTNPDGYTSNLPSIMDFPLQEAIDKGLADARDEWDKGMNLVYEAMAHDFLYTEPRSLLIFLDNHDTARFADAVLGNTGKIKAGITMLATMRGIPQMYYGTELGFRSSDLNAGDGGSRIDFPGGWKGDERNFFRGEGLSACEKDIFEHTKKLFNWRKNSVAIHMGKTIHFLPEQNCYIYFRYTADESVMVIVNASEKKYRIDPARYRDRLTGYTTGTDVITGRKVKLTEEFYAAPRGTMVLEME